jgi:glucose/arabinose dehydrogenase
LLSLKSRWTVSLLVVLALIFTSISFTARTGAQTLPVVLAPGFEFNIFARPENVPEFAGGPFAGPSAIAFDARGRLFVATLSGKILILPDNDDNGVLDEVKVFASNVSRPLGLEFHTNGDLYVTSNLLGGAGRILRLRDTNHDDLADEQTIIVDGLPSEGEHQTNKLKFGPDGLLYFGQGSSTDNGTAKEARPVERPLNATILRVDVNNPQVEVFARGLRNPFGMAFDPVSKQLFSTDGGSGEICQSINCPPDNSPPEEVNWVVQGGNYGFPLCEGTPTADNPNCAGVRAPVTQFLRHLTPTSIAFYTGPQAGESKNQMLVTLFKHLYGQGGDLRRFVVSGNAATGFQLAEVTPPIAEFGLIDPNDGPVDTVIDPISGDIYVVRVDPVNHSNPNEHHHFIYRIHRAGSDLLPFIGAVSPASVKKGSGAVTISLTGRHLKRGAVVVADGSPVATREGASVNEITADLPASLTDIERTITIEVRNPDGSLSNPQSFLVTKGDIVPPPPDKSPQLTALFVYKKKRSNVENPVTVGAKAKKLKLVVTGLDFDAGAQLLVNGEPLEMVSQSATEMVGQVTKQMVAAAGELAVQVRNSTGKLSNTLKLLISP